MIGRIRRPIYRPAQFAPQKGPSMPKIMIAVTCPDCDGAGSYYVQIQGRPETKHIAECQTCHGNGEVIE